MSEIEEARLVVGELLGVFAYKRLSPCTMLALGNLAMVAGHSDDASIGKARQRASDRQDIALERAFEMATAV